MKHYRKLLSLLLIICISMTMLTGYIPVNAVTPATETRSESMTPFELPDIVDTAEAEEKGYIGRVKTEEKDLHTFVFANGDGTNTMRVYSHPVKYVAKDGTVRDISLDVKAKADGGFVTADHEIITTFEKTLTDGISLAYDDVEVTLIPKLGLGKVPAATLDSNNKVVTYKMNDATSFVYELTYAGFKEDIVVKEYTGQTEYEFTLYTNGLTLCKGNESFYLADSDGNRKATIGDIIVFTADERNNTMGSMTYETVRANQEYVLTIHLDADYLSDEKTAYPIRIDPTIEINYDSNGAGAIEDITINSLQGSDGSSRSLFVGRRDTYGLSRVLMKFPNLSLNGISANQITSATVELRDLICQGDEDITVECCIYNTNAPAWVEDETTSWQSVGSSYVGSLLDSHVISYGEGNVVGEQHRYSFDILTAAKAWANGTEDPNKGLVFKANSTFENQTGDAIKTWYKTFSSYNRGDYQPSLCITYRAIIDVSVDATYLLVGGTRQVYCSTSPSGLSVSWESNDTSIATVNTSGLVTGISKGTVKITATYIDSASGTTSSDYVYLYVKDFIGIQDNTEYYVMNYNSMRYLSLETATDTNLTNVFTRARSTSNLSKWKTKRQSNGSYLLISVYSPTGKCLDVTNTNVDIYSNNGSSYSKFSIYRISSGTYKGLYYIRHGKYYVAQDSDYNVYLTTTANSSAVWSFMAVDQRYAELFCHDYTYTEDGASHHFDTSVNETCFRSVLNGLGYTSISYVNPTSETAYTYLKRDDDIFVFMGHGGSGRIAFYKEGNIATGRILAHTNMGFSNPAPFYISDLSDNELCLNRCVIYLGCNTGTDYVRGSNTYNLVDATFEKGAHFVLGTTETLDTNQINDWLEYFLDAISEGMSISQAMVSANSELGTIAVPYDKEDGTEGKKNVYGLPSYYCGDRIQYLDIS